MMVVIKRDPVHVCPLLVIHLRHKYITAETEDVNKGVDLCREQVEKYWNEPFR